MLDAGVYREYHDDDGWTEENYRFVLSAKVNHDGHKRNYVLSSTGTRVFCNNDNSGGGDILVIININININIITAGDDKATSLKSPIFANPRPSTRHRPETTQHQHHHHHRRRHLLQQTLPP